MKQNLLSALHRHSLPLNSFLLCSVVAGGHKYTHNTDDRRSQVRFNGPGSKHQGVHQTNNTHQWRGDGSVQDNQTPNLHILPQMCSAARHRAVMKESDSDSLTVSSFLPPNRSENFTIKSPSFPDGE